MTTTLFDEWKANFGVHVIVRSNENEPFKIGELKDIANIYCHTQIPVVESGGKIWYCFGVVIPYSDEMHTMLDKLTPTRQWEVLRDISIAIQLLRSPAKS